MSKTLTFDSRRASLLLKEVGVQALVEYCYSVDSELYDCSKQTEGQYSYLKYIRQVRRITKLSFDEVLPGQKETLRDSLPSCKADAQKARNRVSIIVLNNTSLLAHVSVLCSMAKTLNDELGASSLFVICLFATGEYPKWNTKLSNAGLQVLQLSAMSLYERLRESDFLLRPAQYIWWGWPPGQWLGPLACPEAKHRSVSFKYDFPSAERFSSHHIGYGEEYAKNISDHVPVYGFHQPISAASIPGLSLAIMQKVVSARTADLQLRPLSGRKTIHIGTLAREEKVAQPTFLSLVMEILKADRRLIFHWTGRAESTLVTSILDQHGLSSRHQFHGWVQPVEFLPKLDIYLDTFPYGTGEAFVTAGYLGLPIATLASPYEANFSNILSDELKNILISKSTGEYGRSILQIASGVRQAPQPSLLQMFFMRCFDNAIISTLPKQLAL